MNVKTKRSLLKRFGAFVARTLLKFLFEIESKRYTYQPQPWLGVKRSKRDKSSYSRWEAIDDFLKIDSGSMIDIGCNVGFFTFKFAEKGFFALGVDGDSENIHVATMAIKRSNMKSVGFMNAFITPENIKQLPKVDVITFFSVWHHWIGLYGIDDSRKMLGELWLKVNNVLFFEGGEDTELDYLGINESADEWILKELKKICVGGIITKIGKNDSGTHKEISYRSLYAIEKSK